jgi:hypothetical protein
LAKPLYLFIYFLFFFFVLLFICAYKAWVISPPCPHPIAYQPLHPLPLPHQNPFIKPQSGENGNPWYREKSKKKPLKKLRGHW